MSLVFDVPLLSVCEWVDVVEVEQIDLGSSSQLQRHAPDLLTAIAEILQK